MTIPDQVTRNGVDYNVTEIGGFAFLDCIGLTSVIISNSVEIIGEGAINGTYFW